MDYISYKRQQKVDPKQEKLNPVKSQQVQRSGLSQRTGPAQRGRPLQRAGSSKRLRLMQRAQPSQRAKPEASRKQRAKEKIKPLQKGSNSISAKRLSSTVEITKPTIDVAHDRCPKMFTK